MAKHPAVHGTARLTLKINDQQYTIIPNGINQHMDCPQYLLKKVGTDTKYSVRKTNAGVQCSCPDFLSRKRDDGACKHIKALQSFYMLL